MKMTRETVVKEEIVERMVERAVDEALDEFEISVRILIGVEKALRIRIRKGS